MKNLRKIVLCILVLALAAGMLFALSRNTGIRNKAEDVRPPLFDTPSYVEIKNGQQLEARLTATESFKLGSLSVVLVNTDADGSGRIVFTLTNDEGQTEWETEISEEAVTVGEWFSIGSPEMEVAQGSRYILNIRAEGCNPYFIKTQKDATNKVLPFDEKVYADGEELSTGISMGVSIVSNEALTYGDVFYFSRLLTIILAFAGIMIILLGRDKCLEILKGIPVDAIIQKVGNEVFLMVLFVLLCMSIAINGYLEGINISADSAGYLREAVNMAAGHGFHYDGLAGYDNTWFANWPIIYPLMIAAVMKVTGMEVYAASKVLSMLLVGAIIVLIRVIYKKDAWFYALFMTNLGLMYLYWYSWSELPFILFMLMFAYSLAAVLKDEKDRIRGYVLLGISMALCFLTRYFGMFTFFVAGLYILVLILHQIGAYRRKEELHIRKIVSLIVTCGVSGVICLLYLINNKIQNGMPSGVSRSMWWDDYQSLTNDLVKALLAEIFNLFHIDIPSYISGLSYGKSVLIVMLTVIVLAVFILKNCGRFTTESVLITTSVIYYGMFIVIRYFSSMDTFYYRFFAPATFLLTLGLAGILIGFIRDKKIYGYLMVVMTVYLGIFIWGDYSEHIAVNRIPYYDIVKMSWDEDYAEIPDRSVVIFSTLDYRSLFYRKDVIEGTINPDDTMDTLRDRYYGSSSMCILTGDARQMLEADFYDESINEALRSAMDDAGKYCVIALR